MEDNLKKEWSETRFNISAGNISEITINKRKTALQSLAKRYRTFSYLSLLSLAFVPSFYHIPERGNLLLAIIYSAILCIGSAMDHWLYLGIKQIDCATMSVAEVSRRAMLYRKRHLQFVAILLPAGFLFLGLMIYFCNDSFLASGAIVGGLIGGTIGFRQLLNFLSDYKEMK